MRVRVTEKYTSHPSSCVRLWRNAAHADGWGGASARTTLEGTGARMIRPIGRSEAEVDTGHAAQVSGPARRGRTPICKQCLHIGVFFLVQELVGDPPELLFRSVITLLGEPLLPVPFLHNRQHHF